MIINELLKNLYNNVSPYTSAEKKYLDNGYPHTNIKKWLITNLFENIEPTYIVECGSMIGGSAIVMAKTLKELNKNTEIICIDPFTGDVNMWDWEKNAKWKFLGLEKGIPTIYKRFLANCKYNGFESTILPINTTTTVGIRLLSRLYEQKRITSLPNYIYLDSSHEKYETLIEINLCWNILPSGGVLFGDDWLWDGVQHDVIFFAKKMGKQIDHKTLQRIHTILKPNSTIYNKNILLYKGQWVLFKK